MRLTPTQLKSLCAKYDLTPSKKYGQNYLIENWPIEKMLEAGEINKNDTVLEIGPGFGVLTFALVEKAKKVVAFEIEKKLAEYWDEKLNHLKIKKLKDFGEIEIVYGNALKELKSYKVPKVYKVVANIPYQITSDLLRTLLELTNKPEVIVLMVQKEVAERICAKPRSAGSRQAGDMSVLALSVQYYGEPEIVDIVTKGNFWPSPKVDSAILKITLSPNHLTTQSPNHLTTQSPYHLTTQSPYHLNIKAQDEKFFRVVKAGFAQKRKQLWNNLSKGLKIDGEKVKNTLKKVCGNEKIRAEELSVEQWIRIIECLNN